MTPTVFCYPITSALCYVTRNSTVVLIWRNSSYLLNERGFRDNLESFIFDRLETRQASVCELQKKYICNPTKEIIFYIMSKIDDKIYQIILAFIFHFWSNHIIQNQMYLPQLVSYISEYKTFWNVYSLSTLDFLLFISSLASLAQKCSAIFLEN